MICNQCTLNKPNDNIQDENCTSLARATNHRRAGGSGIKLTLAESKPRALSIYRRDMRASLFVWITTIQAIKFNEETSGSADTEVSLRKGSEKTLDNLASASGPPHDIWLSEDDSDLYRDEGPSMPFDMPTDDLILHEIEDLPKPTWIPELFDDRPYSDDNPIRNEEIAFKRRPSWISSLTLFNSTVTFRSHTPSLFVHAPVSAVEHLFSQRPQFLPLLTAQDVIEISTTDNCSTLLPYLTMLSSDNLPSIHIDCFLSIMEQSKTSTLNTWTRKFVDKIPEQPFELLGEASLRIFRDHPYLLSDTRIRFALSKLTENARVEWLSKFSREQLLLVTAEQYAALRGWDTFEATLTWVGMLPDYAFSLLHCGISESIQRGLKPIHIQNFGDAIFSIDFGKVSYGCMAKITRDFFMRYLEHFKGNAFSPSFGRGIAYADEYILAKLTAEQARYISPGDWMHFSGLQLQHMPFRACAGIRQRALIRLNHAFIPTPSCFEHLHYKHQLYYLSHALYRLPQDILSHLSYWSVKSWPAGLSELVERGVPAEYIQPLGASVINDANHPCRIITDETMLMKIPLLMANMGASCARIISNGLSRNTPNHNSNNNSNGGGDGTEKEAGNNNNQLMSGLEIYTQIMSGYLIAPLRFRAHILAMIHQVTLTKLLKQEEFCRVLGHVEFRFLRTRVDHFTAVCISQFPFLPQLTNEEIYNLGESAFECMNATDMAKIANPLAMSLGQFVRLGSGYYGDMLADHPINGFSSRSIADLPNEYLAALPAATLGAMQASLVKVFSARQLSIIPPTSFHQMRTAQMHDINIAALSIDQLLHLGLDLPPGELCCIPQKQVNRMSKTNRIVFERNPRLVSGSWGFRPRMILCAIPTIVLFFLL